VITVPFGGFRDDSTPEVIVDDRPDDLVLDVELREEVLCELFPDVAGEIGTTRLADETVFTRRDPIEYFEVVFVYPARKRREEDEFRIRPDSLFGRLTE